MKHCDFFEYLLVGFILLLLSQFSNGQTSKSEVYTLSNIEVTIYSKRQNKFLSKVENDGKDEFWNEMNLSLFVVVEVSGKRGSYISNRKVEVSAFEGKRLVLKRVSDLGVIDEATGKYYVPIWLYGPFCQNVIIKARILGQKESSVIKRNLNFQCGE